MLEYGCCLLHQYSCPRSGWLQLVCVMDLHKSAKSLAWESVNPVKMKHCLGHWLLSFQVYSYPHRQFLHFSGSYCGTKRNHLLSFVGQLFRCGSGLGGHSALLFVECSTAVGIQYWDTNCGAEIFNGHRPTGNNGGGLGHSMSN